MQLFKDFEINFFEADDKKQFLFNYKENIYKIIVI